MWDEALCRDGGRLFPEADWFPERENSKAGRKAVKVCRHCPIAAACLATALAAEKTEADRVGIYAGTTGDDRRTLFGALTNGQGKYPRTRNSGMCARGHTYTPANTYTSPSSGQRQCRTCRRNYHLRRAAA